MSPSTADDTRNSSKAASTFTLGKIKKFVGFIKNFSCFHRLRAPPRVWLNDVHLLSLAASFLQVTAKFRSRASRPITLTQESIEIHQVAFIQAQVVALPT